MSKYEFYYDETEHSRKINYKTVSAENYYDNFVTMIVGWSSEKMKFCRDMLLLKKSTPTEKIAMAKSKARCSSKSNLDTDLPPSTNRMSSL